MSTLDHLDPNSAMLTDAPLTIHVVGAGFIDGVSLVTVDSVPLTTVFLSDQELAVDVDPRLFDAATVLEVSVTDATGSLSFTFGIPTWDESDNILVTDPTGELAYVEDTDMSAVATTVGTIGWPDGAENNRIPADCQSTVSIITGSTLSR